MDANSRRLRVLHVYRTYFPDPPGGLQEAIRQICLATSDFNVESAIFTLSPSPCPCEIERPEGRVFRSRSWLAPASCDLGGIASLLRFRQLVAWADVVHYHYPWPFADLLHLLFGRDKPSVMTYHSDIVRQKWLGRLYAPLMRYTLRAMHAVVATSPAYAATSVILRKVVPENRLKVIPLGITESSIQLDANTKQEILRRYRLEGEIFFLALGVLRYYKGLHYLIESAPFVDAKIVIAGSGPEEIHLREMAAALGVDNIVFAGQVSDEEKEVLLQECRALVLPSHLRSEAFGMVLVEASMRAKSMVCCEIDSGTSYVNDDGVTGLVVAPEAPQQLAKAMNVLLADEEFSARAGSAARTRYEELFSGEALGRAYRQLYCDAVCSHEIAK